MGWSAQVAVFDAIFNGARYADRSNGAEGFYG